MANMIGQMTNREIVWSCIQTQASNNFFETKAKKNSFRDFSIFKDFRNKDSQKKMLHRD